MFVEQVLNHDNKIVTDKFFNEPVFSTHGQKNRKYSFAVIST
jgi:hypothetical protein